MNRIMVFATISTLLLGACNGGGDSSVPAYTVTKNTGADSANTPTVMAGTLPGKEIFVQRCAPCHGLGGNARQENAANLQFSTLDSLSITQTIKNGRGSMPMFNGVFADSDLSHLAIYVKSLRK